MVMPGEFKRSFEEAKSRFDCCFSQSSFFLLPALFEQRLKIQLFDTFAHPTIQLLLTFGLLAMILHSCVAKNRGWRPVTEFFVKMLSCRARKTHFFWQRSPGVRLRLDDNGWFFSDCSCAPCKRFSCLNVALLMHGEEDQSWTKWEEKKLELDFKLYSCDLQLLKIALEVRSGRWEGTDHR